MIGIAGLGNMGRAVAERLLAQGETVSVWNRTPGKADGLDVRVAHSPADLAAHCDCVVSILSNDTATEAVYFGENGLVSQPLGGTVIVDMCTMAPERAMDLANAVETQSGLFVECPVGGTIGPARNGQLLGLAGGTDAAFAAASPVLKKMTRRLEHLGPVGTGSAMKLAINLPLMVYWSALGEALGLATGQGIDPARALDILSDSSGAIGAAKTRVPPISEFIQTADPGGTNFALENAIKDMELMIAQAARGDSASGVISAARDRAQAALAAGYGGKDCSLIATFGTAGSDKSKSD